MPLLYVALFHAAGCSPTKPNELDRLAKVTMTIKGHRFDVWIADSSSERERGLMMVTQEQMAPISDGVDRGMIFVFDHDERGSFWMKDTIIPLDIAYLAADGTVVTTYTMAPLDTRYNQYAPTKPYRYVIEVNANRWNDLGVRVGDKVDIPPEIANRRP